MAVQNLIRVPFPPVPHSGGYEPTLRLGGYRYSARGVDSARKALGSTNTDGWGTAACQLRLPREVARPRVATACG